MRLLLSEYSPEECPFKTVVVDVTHKCNMECSNCYIPNRDIPDTPTEVIEEFLSKLPKRTNVRFIGAEPTMRNDLPELIQTARKFGHRPMVMTNGLRLARKEYVEILNNSGLDYVYLSMNGADNDEVYKVLDGGKFATVKLRALRNILNTGLGLHTGTILVKDLSNTMIRRQIDLVVEEAKNLGIRFDTHPTYKRLPPVLRFRNVGLLGRNMGEESVLSLLEVKELFETNLGLTWGQIEERSLSGVTSYETPTKDHSFILPYETEIGTILVRFIDWSLDKEEDDYRGRMTPEGMVANFFSHVKANEFNY